MDVYAYTAEELYDDIFKDGSDFLLLDVRNKEEFSKFNVEGPYLNKIQNLPYFEFIEFEEESLKKVPQDEKIKIVCAKEGSAKYVADLLHTSGFSDIGYLSGGIGTWADLLKPVVLEKNDRYTLYQFIRPGKASLSYGLVCSGEMFIFDPARTIEFYLDFAKKQQTAITRIFETHLQADYISGSQGLAKETGAPIIANENDYNIASFDYTRAKNNGTILCKDSVTSVQPVFTPGHTPGSTSYLIDGRFLVSGDAVFIKSIGRPDLGGKVEEWTTLLFDSIQNVIKKLDPGIKVLPGHYMDWTELSKDGNFTDELKSILEKNNHIYGLETESDLLEFIKKNMRKQPEVYAEIRKINAGLVTPSPEEQKIMDIGKNECAASG